MISTATNQEPDLPGVQQHLEKLESLLEAEFDALKTQNLNRLEALLAEKESAIAILGDQSLESILANLSSQSREETALEMRWQELTRLAHRCRDLQKRNEILVERKLSVVRSALSSLVLPAAGDTIETYDRQGKLSTDNGRVGRLR